MAATTSKKNSSTRSGSSSAGKKGGAGKPTASSKSSSGSGTTAKRGSAKSTSTKTTKTSRSGASKSATRSAGSTSKKSTAKATSGSAKQDTPKSRAAGKRTASGGAKGSGSAAKGQGAPNSKTKKSGSTSSRSTTSSKRSSSSGNGKGSANGSRSGGKGIFARVASAVGSIFSGGEKDVIDLLKEDHRIVDAYFQEVKAHEDANHEKTFKKIKAELDVHAHVEEVIFYPQLLKVGSEELQKIVREGVEEHALVKTLLEEISKLDGKDDVFKAKLKVLIENVEHHVEEEEGEMFPLVEDEFDKESRILLAERVEKEKLKAAGKAKSKATTKKKAQTARR